MPQDVNVQRDSLLQQAKVWDDASESMAKIAAIAESVSYTGDPGRYFEDVMNAYDAARQHISIWCREGQVEMQKIADALVQAYKTYSVTEDASVQQIQSIH